MLYKKVKLSVLGFSFNQSQTGTYGLVLAEEGGLRRLMVVVGTPEAQSIAFKLHKTTPPRPLTHDLIETLLDRLDIVLKEVMIYDYNDGVFFAKLFFEQGEKHIEIESRTSDAVAIALRTDSPIYTTEAIMQELALVFKESDEPEELQSQLTTDTDDTFQYELLQTEELKKMLQEAIETEDYELASVLKAELERQEKLKKKNDYV